MVPRNNCRPVSAVRALPSLLFLFRIAKYFFRFIIIGRVQDTSKRMLP